MTRKRILWQCLNKPQLTESLIVVVVQKNLAPPLSIHCLTNPCNKIAFSLQLNLFDNLFNVPPIECLGIHAEIQIYVKINRKNLQSLSFCAACSEL